MAPVREAVVPYLQVEDDFITGLIREAKHAHDQSGSGARFRPDWDDIHKRFNNHFEGKMLDGSSVMRSKRSQGSIKTHADRLQAVADIRGGKVRKDAEHRGAQSGRNKGRGKRKDNEDVGDEDGNENSEEDDGN